MLLDARGVELYARNELEGHPHGMGRAHWISLNLRMALSCAHKADAACKFLTRAKRVHAICFGGGDGVFELMYGDVIPPQLLMPSSRC